MLEVEKTPFVGGLFASLAPRQPLILIIGSLQVIGSLTAFVMVF